MRPHDARSARPLGRPARATRGRRILEALTLHAGLPLAGVLAGWLLFLSFEAEGLSLVQRGLSGAGVAVLAGVSAALLLGAHAAPFPGAGERGRRNPP